MELRFWNDPESGLPHGFESVPPSQTEKEEMKKQRLPKGWTQKQLRELAQHHDTQTEEEQAAEIESAFNQKGQTLLAVPTELVPEILQLIERKQTA